MIYPKVIHQITRYELEYLLKNPVNMFSAGLYALVSILIVILEGFRQTYLGDFDSAALELVNFILPVFLLLHMLFVLSPMFAEETEYHIWEMPDTCNYGGYIRRLCRLIAVAYYLILLNLSYHIITAVIVGIIQPFSTWKEPVLQIGGEMKIVISWAVWQHYLFAIFSLFFASIIIGAFILVCSRKTKTVMAACAWGIFICLIEYMLNRFSSWGPLQQFNIWQLLTPYRFAFDGPFYYPITNVLVVGGFFTVLVAVSIWNILKNNEPL